MGKPKFFSFLSLLSPVSGDFFMPAGLDVVNMRLGGIDTCIFFCLILYNYIGKLCNRFYGSRVTDLRKV